MGSLRGRLVLALVLSLGVLWTGAGFVVLVTLERALLRAFDEELLRDTLEVRPDLRRALLTGSTDPLEARLLERLALEDEPSVMDSTDGEAEEVETPPRPDVRTQPLLVELQAFEDDAVLFRSSSLAGRALPRVDDLSRSVRIVEVTLQDGTRVRAAGFRLRGRRSEEGTTIRARLVGRAPLVDVLVGRSRAALDRTIWLHRAGLGIGGILGGVLAAFVVRRVLRRGLRPLERLARRAAVLDVDRLDERFLTVDLPDELRPIAEHWNDLLGRLEAGFERERRFSADLAHELRTPIAELKAQAEVALRWPDRADPGRDRSTLEAADRMQALVETLLTLSRWEQGQTSPALERVDVAEALESSLGRVAARVEERGVELVTRIEPCPIEASPTLLASLLDNLTRNAVEHAPRGSRIVLTCRRPASSPQAGAPRSPHDGPSEVASTDAGSSEGDSSEAGERGARWFVRIVNPAPDLVADDVDKLFQRFWRKDAARTDSGHSGLGLALARGCAQAQGMELDARLVGPGSSGGGTGVQGSSPSLELRVLQRRQPPVT